MIQDKFIRGDPNKEIANIALELKNPMLGKVLELAQTFAVSSAAGKLVGNVSQYYVVHITSSRCTLTEQQHFRTGDNMDINAVQQIRCPPRMRCTAANTFYK